MKRKIILLSVIFIAIFGFFAFSLSDAQIRDYSESDELKIVKDVVYSLDKEDGSFYVSDFFSTDELAETATKITIVSEIDGIPVKGIRTDDLMSDSYGVADTVKIPEGIEYIGENAFSALDGVKKIELPETVKEIEKGAFENMEGLEKVILPASVTVIPTDAFLSCRRLHTVEVKGEISYVGAYAFAGCKSLTGFKFSEALVFIGDAAFKGTALTSAYIPSGAALDSTEGIYSYFKDCTLLKKVEFADRRGESFLLGKEFFSGCTSLEKVILPEAKEIIVAAYAFSGCERLKSITRTEKISLIGTKSFYGCGLEGIELSANVRFEDYGQGAPSASAFEGCRQLKKAVFKKSGKTEAFNLPEKTFKDCSLLKRVVLPVTEWETFIGEKAFSGCSRLVGVYNTAKVSEIGKGAFYECISLENFTVPENVTVIHSKTFYGCTKFKKLFLHRNVTEIERNALGECDKLSDIYYEGSKEDFGQIEKPYEFKRLEEKIRYESVYHPVLDDVEVTVGETTATLSWAPDDGAYCYRVYTWEDDRLKRIADINETEFTFENLVPGDEYTLFVRAISRVNGKKVSDPQKECVIIIAGEK